MLEVELAGQRGHVTKTATKLTLAALKKHSLGGCTIDLPQ